MDDKRAYIFCYNKEKRRWVFQPLDSNICMKGKCSVMAYPLESWVTTEAVRYVFSVMCYNYEGAKQQISLYSHASYQTGPIVYQVTQADSIVCFVTKPFLMHSFKIRYGNTTDYRVVPDLLSLAQLKYEVIYLLNLNIAFYTTYAHLPTAHKETTKAHTTHNECRHKTCP